jgi:signal transduction histidine kinase
MKPEGIRKVIAEQSLEGAIIYLSEQIEAGSAAAGHELRTALYQLQGNVEVLEDRVAKLETPQTENPAVSSENGEK